MEYKSKGYYWKGSKIKMIRVYVCHRCNKLAEHYLEHETQYTRTIVRRFWKCCLCYNQSDIEEIDLLKK